MNKNVKKDALICLAAGKSQVPIILAAKRLNYFVIAVDINPHAPGFEFADHNIIHSTHDAKGVIKSLDLLNNQFNWLGILNRSSGLAVLTAAKISQHFCIPGVPIKSAKILLNKDAMREACSKYEFPAPSYKLLKKNEVPILNDDDYPIVIKPSLSIVGKSGISIVRNKKELVKAVTHASEYTINEMVVLEKYIPGSDISFISFVENGKVYSVCYLNEINSEDMKGRVYGKGFKTYDIDNNHNLKTKVNAEVDKIVKSLEIMRSPLMVSFRSDNEGNIFLVEVHLDLGGDLLIEKLFPNALDLDFTELAVNMASGNVNHPINIQVSPSAVLFEDGSQLVSEKDCNIVLASTFKELEVLIVEK